MDLKLDGAQVEALIREGLPAAGKSRIAVVRVAPGSARIRLPFRESMLRPGGVVSGPVLFGAADTAMFAAVLAHCGPELMALTADTQIRFLRAATPGDVVAESTIVKFGRRLVVLDTVIWTDDPARPAANASTPGSCSAAGACAAASARTASARW